MDRDSSSDDEEEGANAQGYCALDAICLVAVYPP